MSAHAQGPWARHERLILAPYATPPNGVAILMDVMGEKVVDANAALIMTAPELLDELRILTHVHDALLADWHLEFGPVGQPRDPDDLVQRALALIAKAMTPVTGRAISR